MTATTTQSAAQALQDLVDGVDRFIVHLKETDRLRRCYTLPAVETARAIAQRLAAEEQNQSQAEVAPAHAVLRAALHEACNQLEGWVAWKSPRKYKPEHFDYIDKLRSIGGDAPWSPAPDRPKVADIEGLVWYLPVEKPDAETEVLVHFKVCGLRTAAWDEELGRWVNENGQPIDDDVLGWAEPRGVMA